MAKAKGSTLDGAIRFLQLDRAEAERRLAPELRHYLEEDVAVAAWYPETDLLALVQAIASMLPGDRDAVLEEMGRTSVREHLDGAYGHLIVGGNERNLNIRAQSLWSSMHDSGTLRVVEQERGRIRLELADYALPSEELCGITRGYLHEVMRLNGLISQIDKRHCAAHGDPACVWDMVWDPETAPSA